MSNRWIFTLLLWGLALAGRAGAQPQANVGVPFGSTTDSFFENNGVNFGFNIPAASPNGSGSRVVGLSQFGAPVAGGINFQQGGAGAAIPPFGGFNPANTNTFGYSIRSPLGTFNFGFNFDQGSSRSNVSQAGSITLQNGSTGFISDSSLQPFVTSVVPVVGGFAGGSQPLYTMPGAAPPVDSFGTSALGEKLERLGQATGPRSPTSGSATSAPPSASPEAAASGATDRFSHDLADARASSAGQPAASIAEIRAQQAADDAAAEAELRKILDQAAEAIARGKPNVARIYYQQVARRATGELKQQALDGLKRTALPPKPAP